MNRTGQPQRIAVTGDVHVERRRIGAQQVIVDRGDLEPAFDHLGQHRSDLGFEQHQIAHRHHAAMGGLERDPAAERQRRLDGHAIQRDVEIGARETVAVHVTGHGRRLSAKYAIDLVPVDLLRLGRRRHQGQDAGQRSASRKISHGISSGLVSCELIGIPQTEEARGTVRAPTTAAASIRRACAHINFRVELGRAVSSMRNRLDTSSVAQSLDVRTRLKGSLRIPQREPRRAATQVQGIERRG